MKKSALTLAALATIGICASLSKGAQLKNDPFIQEKNESFNTVAHFLDFHIPSNFQPVHLIPDQDNVEEWHYLENQYREKGKLNHYTEVYDALLQCDDDEDLFVYCYRVTMDPYWVRNYGFLGIGSDSDNWALYSLETTIQFQKTISFGPQNTPRYSILNFAPQNQPSRTTESIGFDVGVSATGPSADFSATVDYDHDELSVTSGTKIGNPFYKTSYSFASQQGNNNSEYLKNAVYCHGMVAFRYHYNVDLVIQHKIQYRGTAWYELGDAGKVQFGYHMRNR